MRILFMGTPDFAAVSLKRLVEDGHDICGVFTQPDKPRNRNKVTFSPVKEYALSCGLNVYQPVKMRDGTALELVKTLAPELIVVVAYGRILPPDILAVPPLGCVNVHASLLPKYRGAAPINWAMLNGDAETGVSIMYMAEELDAGDVICTSKRLLTRRRTCRSFGRGWRSWARRPCRRRCRCWQPVRRPAHRRTVHRPHLRRCCPGSCRLWIGASR